LRSERAEAVPIKRMQAQLLLAKAKSELIPKKLVQQRASYLLAALGQRVMQLPHTYARRILGLRDVEQARRILTTAARQLLEELQDLPAK
jgi:hypothetical protein